MIEKSGLERTCEVNAVGKNISLTFTVCVKSLPLYHFTLVYILILWLAKSFSKPASKNREICCLTCLYLWSRFS